MRFGSGTDQASAEFYEKYERLCQAKLRITDTTERLANTNVFPIIDKYYNQINKLGKSLDFEQTIRKNESDWI